MKAERTIISPLLEETFAAGTSNLPYFLHRLCKLKNAAIFFCRSGRARFVINLDKFEIKSNTQIVLLPGSVLNIDEMSDDFSVSFLFTSAEMFREVCFRLDSPFFHFLIENPCYTLPTENTAAINGLMSTIKAIYEERDHRFREQIARNHLQCFLMDVYDKVHRYFNNYQIEGRNRQDQLFKKFISLVHDNCTSQRNVTFYADKLCISTKYLTGVVHATTGNPAKKIIDNFTILEIKVLLQSTEFTIQEIADHLHFPDQSYLGRYFKRHEGVSPIEYRSIFISAESV